ncbi:hypothetical protein PCANC_21913 [Puccinia coronata f. sp. avenae]|uniref:t-SNARE coiled-coil homology domain-containing protein n=1 Tax=Puccinia coronata f. sp. avenae TaxID=200324 RepID=A0A2N5S4Z4_9BASI|nr:hypothetical protein PCANC_25681 [Puccinia coronata f. sp. avenae]PLW33818.1 hypothetical protein PCANC_21913 [Puccinia coronata f. sp. avenae]
MALDNVETELADNVETELDDLETGLDDVETELNNVEAELDNAATELDDVEMEKVSQRPQSVPHSQKYCNPGSLECKHRNLAWFEIEKHGLVQSVSVEKGLFADWFWHLIDFLKPFQEMVPFW